MANQFELQQILTKEFLLEKYVKEDQFASDIAREVGCSICTVTTYLRKHGIEVIPKYRNRKCTGVSVGEALLTKDFLTQEYLENKRTLQDICRMTGTSYKTVVKRLHALGISIENHRSNAPTTFTCGIKMEREYMVVYMPKHRDANDRGYVKLHRLIAEYFLNRPLTSSDVVHHLNGDKLDNRPDNLQVMTNSEHTTYHNLNGSRHYEERKLKRYADLTGIKDSENSEIKSSEDNKVVAETS